jgi:hypothetical protein
MSFRTFSVERSITANRMALWRIPAAVFGSLNGEVIASAAFQMKVSLRAMSFLLRHRNRMEL